MVDSEDLIQLLVYAHSPPINVHFDVLFEMFSDVLTRPELARSSCFGITLISDISTYVYVCVLGD